MTGHLIDPTWCPVRKAQGHTFDQENRVEIVVNEGATRTIVVLTCACGVTR